MEALRQVDPWTALDRQVLDDELARVTAAVELASARPGTRVTLTSLRFGGSVVRLAEPLARNAGVTIQRRRSSADGLTELVVAVLAG